MRKTTTTLLLRPAPLTDVPPPPPTPTNEALLQRITAGDGEALHLLFRRHADLVRSVIARSIPDEDQCEDVLREVFEAIRDRAEHYTPDHGRAIGWILTVARRRADDRARRLTRPAAQPARHATSRAGRIQLAHRADVDWHAGLGQAA